jgi:predicted extracellular nuclease
MKQIIVTAIIVLFIASAAQAEMRITEWMYNGTATGSVGEFVEFTNVGSSAINMTGWSFDDSTRVPGSQNLSAFGTVNPGESVLLTDISDTAFRTSWGLASTVKVIGGNTDNLGRADEINLFDASNALVDRLTYDDQTIGGPRTNKISGNPIAFSDLGTNNATRWVLSVASPTPDRYGSYVSSTGDIGNPGVYVDAVPEPSTIVVFLTGMLMAGIVARFRRKYRR